MSEKSSIKNGEIHQEILKLCIDKRAHFTLLNIIIGIGIWLYEKPIARMVVKDLPDDVQMTSKIRLANVHVVAVSLVWLFILSSAIPS
jgi:hypothetical protein